MRAHMPFYLRFVIWHLLVTMWAFKDTSSSFGRIIEIIVLKHGNMLFLSLERYIKLLKHLIGPWAAWAKKVRVRLNPKFLLQFYDIIVKSQGICWRTHRAYPITTPCGLNFRSIWIHNGLIHFFLTELSVLVNFDWIHA